MRSSMIFSFFLKGKTKKFSFFCLANAEDRFMVPPLAVSPLAGSAVADLYPPPSLGLCDSLFSAFENFEKLFFLCGDFTIKFWAFTQPLSIKFECSSDLRFPRDVPTDSYSQRPNTRIKWNWNRYFFLSSTFNVFIDVLNGASSSDGKTMSTRWAFRVFLLCMEFYRKEEK